MPRIKLPDGRVISVPDDARPEEIDAIANDHDTEQPSPQGSAASRFVGGAAEMLNPITMAQGVYQAVRHPVDTVVGIASQMGEQVQKGAQAGREGRYSEAIGHTVAGALPIIGPMAANIGEHIGSTGDIAGGLGQAAGLIAGPKIYEGAARTAGAVGRGASRTVRGTVANQNPAVADAVRYGLREGIPVDLATATGNPAVRGAQYLADRSLGGSVVSTGAKQATDAALKATSERLAKRAHPSAQTPEGVGESVRGAVKDEIRAQKGRADDAYGELRAIEEQATPDQVPGTSMGRSVPSQSVDRAFVLRWLADDLRELPYQQGRAQRIHDIPGATRAMGDGRGDIIFTPHAAGTPTQAMFEKMGMTGSRAELAHSIEQALTGKRQNARLNALADAMREAWDGQQFDPARISDDALVRTGLRRTDFESPMTMPRADTPGFERFFPDDTKPPIPDGPTVPMQLAVNLKAFKESMQPIAERLRKKRELTGALLGGEGRAAMALDSLLSGPDHAPLSVVDAALSDLKGIARGAVMPELRNKGQGVAAAAIRDLDTLVQLRAEAASPQAFEALQRGRQATIAKYSAADVLKSLRKEPVQVFDQAVWKRDAGIDRLRNVAKIAPGEMRAIGRAYLDDLFDTATKKGDFGKTGTIASKWQNLGPQTKALLFPDEALRTDLDRFFLLAEKMATNPNPSGTGYLVSLLTQGGLAVTNPLTLAGTVLSGAVASKAMHSPRVVKLLTQGLQTPSKSMAGHALAKNLQTAIRAAQAGRQATSPTGPLTPNTEPARP